MLASSIVELPRDQVISGLLSYTDIGEFVTNQILNLLSREELQILRIALVLRASFTLDVLNGIYQGYYNVELPINSIRQLTRRAILEYSTRPQETYYLHNLIRDAIPRETDQEGKVHALVAKWFMDRPFDPADVTTWDDILYHLHRAMEVGQKEEYYQSYFDFVMDNLERLSFAGWHYRINDELSILYSFAIKLNLPWDQIVILWNIGHEFSLLNMIEEQKSIYRQLVNAIGNAILHSDLDKASLGSWLGAAIAELGNAVTTEGKVEDQNNSLKIVLAFAKFLGSNTIFYPCSAHAIDLNDYLIPVPRDCNRLLCTI